jgi:TRAP-type C4-dicarboxylate transport system permease large subunit
MHSGQFVLLLAILGITAIMGMFIDPIAITMICLPIFLPAIKSVGLDPYTVVLLYLLACTIGYLTPPFGMNLFYLKSVAPADISMSDLYRGVIPFVFVKFAVLMLFLIFPSLLLWLPNAL